MTDAVKLISPHGGVLIDRLVDDSNRSELLKRAKSAPTVTLSEVVLSDVELIATGIVSPLTGFMDKKTYQNVLDTMHLPEGLPWTIPVTLPVDTETAEKFHAGQDVGLLTPKGELIALLELKEKYTYDKRDEAEKVYRTTDEAHPGVARVYDQGDVYLAGDIWVFDLPTPEFPAIYRTPALTRHIFQERGWKRIVAFQTRNPIHRAHEYLQKVALEMTDGIMLHPLVGATKSDDIPAEVRIESYETVIKHYYPDNRVLLAVFPAAMRYAGPREAVFHAICRKNYGCSHFIVGRDHAGVGNYYGTYDAQNIFDEFDPAKIGIVPLCFEHAFYCNLCQTVVTAKTCPHGKGEHWVFLSGTQVREKLRAGEMLPVEFTRPEVSEVLIRGIAKQQAQSSD